MRVRKITSFVKRQLLLWLLLIGVGAFAQTTTPTITSYSPTRVTQRTTVTITGTNFTNPTNITAVRFTRPGGTATAATSFQVVNNTTITAILPLVTGVTSGTEAQLTVTVVRGSTVVNGATTLAYIAPAATPAGSGITRVITNWNGYWSSSAASGVAANQPDTGHSLMAFRYNGVLYSTGTEAAVVDVLNSNSATTGAYTQSNFRALPVNNISGTVPSATDNPNLIVLGSMVDGSSTRGVPTAPSVAGLSVRDVLIDGIRGLNLGSGVTNLPSTSVLNFQSGTIFNNTVIDDAIPDILVSQVAQPSSDSFSVYCFVDVNGNIVGNPVQIDLSAVTPVGTYKTDFFTLPVNEPLNTAVINGTRTIGANTRDIRLVGYKLSDFGITSTNRTQAVGFKVMPSGTSDPAFMAYNRNSFQIPAPEISAHPVSQAVCPNGSAQFSVSVTATGTEISYQWERNGVALTNGNGVSGATTATLTINPVLASSAAVYRCLVTNPSGAAFSNPAYLNTVVLSATGAETCQGTPAFVEVGAQGNTPQYQWYSNTTNSNTGGTLIGGATSRTYSPSVTTAGTTYYYAEVYPQGFACAATRSSAVAFTVNYANAGTITGNQTVCAGNNAVVSISGSAGSIQWQQSTDGSTWTNVTTGTGATTASYTTGILTTTTRYRAVTSSGTSVVCTSASDPVTVTVNDTNVWTGASDIYWNNSANWACGSIPTQYTIVSIPSAPVNQPTVVGLTGHAKSITISNGASLIVATSGSLQVVNEVNVVTGGSFTVNNNGSLIQDNAVGNTGNITVIKNTNPLYRLDYTMWSSPVSGQQLLAFSPLTNTGRFYEYKYAYESSIQANVEQYFLVNPSTTNFETAKGYLIRMPNSNSTTGYNAGSASIRYPGTFTGVPHNGTITYPLSTQGSRYTATGNPYPSPIGLVEFFAANSGVIDADSGIYLWRKRNDYQVSSYATLTLLGLIANTATPFGGGNPPANYTAGGQDQAVYYQGSNANWRLAQGQGFLVRTAENQSNPVITYNNAMRKEAPASGNQGFFRTAQNPMSRVWLNLSGVNNSFSQTAIGYVEGATTGVDYGYDAAAINSGGLVSLYSLAADKKLGIQARPAFTSGDIVPMGYSATDAGTYTISIDHKDGVFEEGQEVFIKDNLLGTVTSLANAYSFTTNAGTIEDRFEIVYAREVLGNNNPELNANSIIVFKEGTAININSGTALMNGVRVLDIHGRELYTKNGINATETVVNGLQVQQQVLIVEIDTVKGKVSKKIVF
ncbi:hypothetical protein GR160_14995 [Flavobacterium sp. Sd200]|uniref:immunoglobulin domain-containing protein n=1 Tax=Flavobacterium sp. Sd200 TaxID=2692211 RepID=UPI001369AAE4|nr:immunoglobulin domain-containing protein [Flavobacterium sp. Sd200]MXN92535.1 hypothetical protein [Flavobacterium sp. Sd200]